MPDDKPENGDIEALKTRREALRQALDSRRSAGGAANPKPQADAEGRAIGYGLRAASEFAAAVLVGAAIGFGLDHVFGTRPWLSIVFFFLGVASGVWNVIRIAMPKGPEGSVLPPLSRESPAYKGGPRPAGEGANGAPGRDDDED